MHSRSLLPLAAASGMLLAACTRQENDRLALGEDMVLPAFQEPVHTLATPPTSLTGLDRSNWEPVVYVIPVNGVAHQPPYAPPTFTLDTLPRQRGEQPTAETALDLGEPDAGAEIAQTLQSHGLAALDAVLFVPRLFVRSPSATNWSPRVSYERAPAAAITAPWCAECGGPCVMAQEPEMGAEPVGEATPAEPAPLESAPSEPAPEKPPAQDAGAAGQ